MSNRQQAKAQQFAHWAKWRRTSAWLSPEDRALDKEQRTAGYYTIVPLNARAKEIDADDKFAASFQIRAYDGPWVRHPSCVVKINSFS